MAQEVAERGSWGGQVEFLLTCIGFSVGLGNIWRFPYLAYEYGGGAFIIPYLIFLVLIGIPMYTMELSMGQFASLGPTAVWKSTPLFKGIGFASLMVSWYIMIYFNVIISWALFYLFSSFQKTLPWTTCGNHWNTDACQARGGNITFNSTTNTTPTEEFFYREVLERSDGIEHTTMLNWRLALLLLLSWVIVFLVLLKGVQSLGKVSYVVSTFPYVLLTVFLIKGVTLPGATEGIIYYLYPDWNRMLDLEVWGRAATQIFYSTGVCMGNLIAMASYNKFNNKVLRDGLMIPLINSATSIYSGFVIFSILGYMSHEMNVPIKEVATQGPGLVFVVYPEGLSTMPLPQLWSALFFLMMTFIGYSSQFSYGETLIGAIQDELPVLREKRFNLGFRGAFCLFGFFCGLPMVTDSGYYIFSILNDYSGTYPLLVTGLLELLAINYVYGFQKFADDIYMMVGRKPNIFLKASWKITTPLLVFAIMVFLITKEKPHIIVDGKMYPEWGFMLAWLIAAFPFVCIFVVGLYQFCIKGGWEALHRSIQSEKTWGPAKTENRTGRYDRRISKVSRIREDSDISSTGSEPGDLHISSEANILPKKKAKPNHVVDIKGSSSKTERKSSDAKYSRTSDSDFGIDMKNMRKGSKNDSFTASDATLQNGSSNGVLRL